MMNESKKEERKNNKATFPTRFFLVHLFLAGLLVSFM